MRMNSVSDDAVIDDTGKSIGSEETNETGTRKRIGDEVIVSEKK